MQFSLTKPPHSGGKPCNSNAARRTAGKPCPFLAKISRLLPVIMKRRSNHTRPAYTLPYTILSAERGNVKKISAKIKKYVRPDEKWTKCTEIRKNLVPFAKKYGHPAQKRPILNKTRQNVNNPTIFDRCQMSGKDSQMTTCDNQKAAKRIKNGKKNKKRTIISEFPTFSAFFGRKTARNAPRKQKFIQTAN